MARTRVVEAGDRSAGEVIGSVEGPIFEENRVEVATLPISAHLDGNRWVLRMGEQTFDWWGGMDAQERQCVAFIMGATEGLRFAGKAAALPFSNGMVLIAEPGGVFLLTFPDGRPPEHYQSWPEVIGMLGTPK